MFERLYKMSPVAWSAVVSLAAMVALNIFALNQQLQETQRFAAPVTIMQSALA